MSRVTAWVIVLAAAGLIYSLAFTTYDLFTGSWQTNDDGALVEIYVECPSPLQVLMFGDEPDGERLEEGLCVRSSRTLALEAGVVALAAGLLAWAPVTRRRPRPIGPMSEQIEMGSTQKD